VLAEVFSIDGRRVRTLADGMREAGVHRLAWDGRDDQGHAVGAGIYFLRTAADRRDLTRRVTLIR
jgi:flagellar hook assembly protein FlgD